MCLRRVELSCSRDASVVSRCSPVPTYGRQLDRSFSALSWRADDGVPGCAGAGAGTAAAAAAGACHFPMSPQHYAPALCTHAGAEVPVPAV